MAAKERPAAGIGAGKGVSIPDGDPHPLRHGVLVAVAYLPVGPKVDAKCPVGTTATKNAMRRKKP